jgi:predicted Rossmann fold nucleotide-binding protein DprA/Smf involved in DNA uptake
LVTSGKEMARDMNWHPLSEVQPRKIRLSADETLLLLHLSKQEPMSIDVLQLKTDLPLPDLNATLLSLQLMQFIEVLPGKRYRAL